MTRRRRYVVGEVAGFRTAGRGGYGVAPGVSVAVTDSAYCHRVVEQFRSEDMVGANGGRRGVEGARVAGAELAARLNREFALTTRRCDDPTPTLKLL